MNNRASRGTHAPLYFSFLIFALSPKLAAQSTAPARMEAGLAHNFSGVWKPGPSDLSPSPSMTPHAQAQFEVNTQELKRDHPITIEPNPARITISIGGRIIADTREALTRFRAGGRSW